MAKKKKKGKKKGKKKKIWEASPKELLAIIKEHKLLMVVGSKTEVPALIYKKTYDSDRHDKVKSATEFIKMANKQGYVIATDGTYARPWTSNYYVKKTGKKTKAKKHSRKAATYEELRKKAKSMKLKGYTKLGKKSGERKKALAAAIRRKKKGPKKKKAKKKKAKKKAKKKKGRKGKYAKLKKEEE